MLVLGSVRRNAADQTTSFIYDYWKKNFRSVRPLQLTKDKGRCPVLNTTLEIIGCIIYAIYTMYHYVASCMRKSARDNASSSIFFVGFLWIVNILPRLT